MLKQLSVPFLPLPASGWGEALILENSDAEALIAAVPHKRFVVTLNGKHTQHSSIQRVKGTYFIMLSKTKRKEYGIEPGETVDLRIEEDTSKYGMVLPEEWAELMEQDPLVREAFEAQTPGRRRNILFNIAGAKTVETRVRRAVDFAEYLVVTGQPFDFKKFSAYLRQRDQ